MMKLNIANDLVSILRTSKSQENSENLAIHELFSQSNYTKQQKNDL